MSVAQAIQRAASPTETRPPGVNAWPGPASTGAGLIDSLSKTTISTIAQTTPRKCNNLAFPSAACNIPPRLVN